MKKCIYTLKDDNEATFNEKEHIFPKSIGGTNTLPNGWVSDEFNNEMSKLERKFFRENPLMVIPRVFEKQTGRKNHTGKLGVSFLKKLNTNELVLGYIENGHPHVIPQMISQYPILANEAVRVEMIVTDESDIVSFMDKLKSCGGNIKFETITIIEDSFMDKISLGFVNKRFYVGAHSQLDGDQLCNYVKTLLEKIQHSPCNTYDKRNEREKPKSLVDYQFHFRFDDIEASRVIAKIAFNCLAYIKGQEFVLKSEFDKFRRAIVTGENIKNYVSARSVFESDIVELLSFDKEHFSIFISTDGGIIGNIGFYGGMSLFAIHLSDTVPSNFNCSITGYICDWQNKSEPTLFDYLSKRDKEKWL